MKNLAYMETRKLSQRLQAQEALRQELELAAQALIHHYPHTRPQAREGLELWLMIGAERGFCGDFNERLLRAVQAQLTSLAELEPAPMLMGVGHKLCAYLESWDDVTHCVAGIHAAEEIEAHIGELVHLLSQLEAERGPLRLKAWFNDPRTDQVTDLALLPPFESLAISPTTVAPLLYIPPEEMMLGLGEHYLFALLHECLGLSALAENQQRIQHLQGAVHRLDERVTELARQSRTLRQEEITEEIEIILLNTEGTSLREQIELEVPEL